jgi:hypothetical protein
MSSRSQGRKKKQEVSSQQVAEGSGWEGGDRLLITKPTASGMECRVLCSIAYRGLPCISSITELANALNVPDWNERTTALQKHKLCSLVEIALLQLCSTPFD